MQVDIGKLFRDEIEQAALVQSLDLRGELEALEHITHLWRESIRVLVEVLPNVVLVAHELLHVHGRGVVEARLRLPAQKRVRVDSRLLARSVFDQHRFLGGLEHTVQAPQHREGQDHLAVFGLLVVAAQQVSDRPDEGRKCLVVHSISRYPASLKDSAIRSCSRAGMRSFLAIVRHWDTTPRKLSMISPAAFAATRKYD